MSPTPSKYKYVGQRFYVGLGFPVGNLDGNRKCCLFLKTQPFVLRKFKYAYFVTTQEPQFRPTGFVFLVLFLLILAQFPLKSPWGMQLTSSYRCSHLWGWVASFCWSFDCFLHLLATKPLALGWKAKAGTFCSPAYSAWQTKVLHPNLSTHTGRAFYPL